MALSIPKVSSYGKYRTGSYGKVNTLYLTIGDIVIYYSYTTPVAFYDSGHNLIIRENDWGRTTGIHLNWIDDDKSKRIPGAQFMELLTMHMAQYGKLP